MAPPRLKVNQADLTAAGGRLKQLGQQVDGPASTPAPNSTNLATAMPGMELGRIDLATPVQEALMACGGRAIQLGDMLDHAAATYDGREATNQQAFGRAADSLSQAGDFNEPLSQGR